MLFKLSLKWNYFKFIKLYQNLQFYIRLFVHCIIIPIPTWCKNNELGWERLCGSQPSGWLLLVLTPGIHTPAESPSTLFQGWSGRLIEPSGSGGMWLLMLDNKRHSCCFTLLDHSLWGMSEAMSWWYLSSSIESFMWHRTEAFCQQRIPPASSTTEPS